RRIDLEEETVAMIEEGIEDNRQAIIDIEVRITRQLSRHDTGFMTFVADGGNVKGCLVEEYAHFRLFGGWHSLDRLALRQRPDGLSSVASRFVETTVDMNASRRPTRGCHWSIEAHPFGLLARLCRAARAQRDPAPQNEANVLTHANVFRISERRRGHSGQG